MIKKELSLIFNNFLAYHHKICQLLIDLKKLLFKKDNEILSSFDYIPNVLSHFLHIFIAFNDIENPLRIAYKNDKSVSIVI